MCSCIGKILIMLISYKFCNFNRYTTELSNEFAVEINGKTGKGKNCRVWVNKLDRKDGSFIVRYKVYETCYDLSINLYYKSKPIKDSPFIYKGLNIHYLISFYKPFTV